MTGWILKLSISVVCYDSSLIQLQSLLDSLIESIKHLRTHYTLPTIPIFIIDNSDEVKVTPELYRWGKIRLEARNAELYLISGHGNIGYGRGHNLVLNRIDSDFHLLLNPDVTLEKDVLFRGLSCMRENKEIAALSPKTIDLEGSKQYLCKNYPSIFTLLIRGLGLVVLEKIFSGRLSSYEMRGLSEDKLSVREMLLSGCFMLVDTMIFKAVNGFDEVYFLYFEDFDLSLRLSKFGKLAYAPQVQITHSGGKTSSKGLWHVWNFCKSGVRFFNTYGWRFL